MFILTGMLMLIAAGTMLLLYNAGSSAALRLAAMGALGLGAGATVSPALFLCGLPLQANLLGRIFALIELVRSAADLIIAPVMLRIARLASGSLNHAIEMNGFHEAIFITLMIAVAATAIRSACCYSVEQFCPFRTSTLGSLKTRRRSNLRRFLTV